MAILCSGGPRRAVRRPRPSGRSLLHGLVEVADGLLDRDLGRVGGLLQIVVGDVSGVAVGIVRLAAPAGETHGAPPFVTAWQLPFRATGLSFPDGSAPTRSARANRDDRPAPVGTGLGAPPVRDGHGA